MQRDVLRRAISLLIVLLHTYPLDLGVKWHKVKYGLAVKLTMQVAAF